jgi:glycine/D-amino acid oxidase-like deaminating enzyme
VHQVRSDRLAARRRGVRVFEHTPASHVAERGGRIEVRTPYGTIRADRGLIATNAYAHAIPALRRHIFTVYAHIIMTRPLTAAQWQRVGWQRRMGVEDKRIFPHFSRPTPDGRILWGGRDAPFPPLGPILAGTRTPGSSARWKKLSGGRFRNLRTWPSTVAGPVCGCVNCFATAGFLDRSRRLAYALGYAGHGVGQSYLVGKVISDLLLDRASDLMDLPMVTKPPIRLPPGLLRSGLLRLSGRALQRADDRGRPSSLARVALRALQ